MHQDQKRIFGWLLVAVVIIGSFLMIIFASQNEKKDDPYNQPDSPTVLAPVTPNEWIKGNPQARVELVEYSDFQCPACKSRLPQVEEILKTYGDKIKFVYRHFPLKLNHKNAELASKSSEAAGLQGKFWEMHDLLFQNQSGWQGLTNQEAKETFIAYAKQLALDERKFVTDIDSQAVQAAVDEDYSSGLAAGINATPTFFLDGSKITPYTFEEFKSLIEDAINTSGPVAK